MTSCMHGSVRNRLRSKCMNAVDLVEKLTTRLDREDRSIEETLRDRLFRSRAAVRRARERASRKAARANLALEATSQTPALDASRKFKRLHSVQARPLSAPQLALRNLADQAAEVFDAQLVTVQ